MTLNVTVTALDQMTGQHWNGSAFVDATLYYATLAVTAAGSVEQGQINLTSLAPFGWTVNDTGTLAIG